MSRALEIGIETRPLERVGGDVLVVGAFEDDRPLRGGAARVDWRLCGQLSELILAGRISGERGDAVLLPSSGSICAHRVLLVGLGERRRFTLATARQVMQDAAQRCLALGVHRIVAAPLGMASDDFPRHVESVIQGLIDAMPQSGEAVELILALPASQADAAERALETALLGRSEVAISLRARTADGAQTTASANSFPASAPGGETPPPV